MGCGTPSFNLLVVVAFECSFWDLTISLSEMIGDGARISDKLMSSMNS
jgi:hypothetical protein